MIAVLLSVLLQCHQRSSLQSTSTLAVWACPSLEGMSTEAVPSPTYRDSTYLETMAVGEFGNMTQ